MKGILRFWWLVLAWLLAILGDDFWHFNVMEAFATVAILIGVGIAIRKWRNEHIKRNRLISFPYDKWSAKINADKDIVSFTLVANVLVPFHAYGLTPHIVAGKKRLSFQNYELIPQMMPKAQQEGSLVCSGELLIADIPKGIKTLQVRIGVRLDGEIVRTSKAHNVPIEPPIPDKVGSQT